MTSAAGINRWLLSFMPSVDEVIDELSRREIELVWQRCKGPAHRDIWVEHQCNRVTAALAIELVWQRCKGPAHHDIWVEHQCNRVTAALAYAMATMLSMVGDGPERSQAIDGLTSALQFTIRGIEKREDMCDTETDAEPGDE